MQDEAVESFADIKKRLNEIADCVSNADLPLEEALTLYEEAVNLGLHATNLLESDIAEDELEEVKETTAEASSEASTSEESAPTQGSQTEDPEPAPSHPLDDGSGDAQQP